jgi:hypothetical protein
MLSYKNTLRFFSLILLLTIICSTHRSAAAGTGFYYQIKVYHFKNAAQQQVTENYLKDVFVPNLHKSGFKQIGVFTLVEPDTADRRLYVLIPFKSWESMKTFESTTSNVDLSNTSNAYINAAHNNAPYTRIETIILSAFDKMPSPAVPNLSAPKSERVYELRSYEGPTEKYYINKVKMFNVGDEVALFKRLGFNAVFYAGVIAGSRMPNLMYMTTFNSKQDREEHWKAFSNDAYWKKLSSMPEYQNNVSKADIIFLRPAAYSDF